VNVSLETDASPDDDEVRRQQAGDEEVDHGRGEQKQPEQSLSDPFDPASLRLSQDFASGLGIKKLLNNVPVRKPSKEHWIRVHPEEGYRMQTAVLELKEDRETYLVSQQLRPELASESTFGFRMIFTMVNRQGVVSLWPVKLPGTDGKIDTWNSSALEAAQLAMTRWVRVAANMDLGAYDVFTTEADLPQPTWPTASFRDLLATAFKNKLIENLDHPVLRQLRGEI